jgi:hypothetical protein
MIISYSDLPKPKLKILTVYSPLFNRTKLEGSSSGVYDIPPYSESPFKNITSALVNELSKQLMIVGKTFTNDVS